MSGIDVNVLARALRDWDVMEDAAKGERFRRSWHSLSNMDRDTWVMHARYVLARYEVGLGTQAAQATASAPSTAIAPGDVVSLRSGGPLMVVEEVRLGVASCFWVDASGDGYNASDLPLSVLVKESP